MSDDAARWRSSLHFARLIRNNRRPLTQSQSWSNGQESNHSWKLARWLVRDGQAGSYRFVCRIRSSVDRTEPSGVTSKAANGGHFKTGQRKWPGTRLFYSAASCGGKSVFVRQLRGPHLSTW